MCKYSTWDTIKKYLHRCFKVHTLSLKTKFWFHISLLKMHLNLKMCIFSFPGYTSRRNNFSIIKKERKTKSKFPVVKNVYFVLIIFKMEVNLNKRLKNRLLFAFLWMNSVSGIYNNVSAIDSWTKLYVLTVLICPLIAEENKMAQSHYSRKWSIIS